MKMSDVFQLPMVQGSTVLMSGDHRYAIEFDSSDTNTGAQIEHVAHAINNHDRMVEEIAELKGVLTGLVEDAGVAYRFGCDEKYYTITSGEIDDIKLLLAKLNQEGEE